MDARTCQTFSSSYPLLHHKDNTTTSIAVDIMSQPDQLDQAASYIKQLRERIEKLKQNKERAMISVTNSTMNEMGHMGLRLPLVELRELGSSIEVILISGLQRNFMLHEVISILEEEGADVVSASFSTVGDKIFHSVHAQVRISRVGVETSRVCQRLQDLVAEITSEITDE